MHIYRKMSSEVAEEESYIEYIPTYEDGGEFVENLIVGTDTKVEYLEEEEDENMSLEGHTIILHDGEQYLIPNGLGQAGRTIILQDEDGKATQYVINSEESEVLDVLDSEKQFIVGDDTEGGDAITEYLSGASDKCYMVLDSSGVDLSDSTNLEGEQLAAFIKDGQLHFEASDLVMEQISEETDESSSRDMEQVMGKNLITGETITLSGLFDKMKKHKSPQYAKQTPDYLQQEDSEGFSKFCVQQSESLDGFEDTSSKMLHRKIPVGTSVDGKKVYGRILEIRKGQMDMEYVNLEGKFCFCLHYFYCCVYLLNKENKRTFKKQ